MCVCVCVCVYVCVCVLFPTNALADKCPKLDIEAVVSKWTNAQDCGAVAPCSNSVILKKGSTCTEFCQSDKLKLKNRKCVGSWTSKGQKPSDDAVLRCEASSLEPCGKTYTKDTQVVCVCAVVAKCTLYAKCDFNVDAKRETFRVANMLHKNAIEKGKGFSIDPRT